jgi:tRNA uridine 5-carbamoylmethylation protein Kti12
MKLVFLYGPPAVGKYTVGTMLAEQTGYKFVHNHVTVDVAKLLFPRKTPENRQAISDLKDALRLDIIRTAVRSNVDIITTLAYRAGESDRFVQDVMDIVSAGGGAICFVRLTAPREVLYERISDDARAALHKKADPESLKRKFAEGGLDEPFPGVENLTINTGDCTPDEAAQRIISNFALYYIS